MLIGIDVTQPHLCATVTIHTADGFEIIHEIELEDRDWVSLRKQIPLKFKHCAIGIPNEHVMIKEFDVDPDLTDEEIMAHIANHFDSFFDCGASTLWADYEKISPSRGYPTQKAISNSSNPSSAAAQVLSTVSTRDNTGP